MKTLIKEKASFQEITRSLSIHLSSRQLCDLYLLFHGAFSPLTSFLSKKDYMHVLRYMRLESGQLWPMPIQLDLSEIQVKNLEKKDSILLKDSQGVPLASMKVQEVYLANKELEAQSIFNSDSIYHPGVAYLFQESNPYYVHGPLTFFKQALNELFPQAQTPKQCAQYFQDMQWKRIVAFQTRNPLHKAHYNMTLMAAKKHEAQLLIHPVIGPTKAGDVQAHTRQRCYEACMQYYPKQEAHLALLPLAMRMAGPKEALWHTLIRKNFSCTHMIIGRDHAGPGDKANGEAFYGHFAAQKLVKEYEEEIGMEMVPFSNIVYSQTRKSFLPQEEIKQGEETKYLSGTELRKILEEGKDIPSWFTFPQVAKILKNAYKPMSKRGVVIFFTGLSGAGKSTLASKLSQILQEKHQRLCTVLDGDLVRHHLCSELGFSKKDRDTNILRIAYVASQIAAHGGIAICAPIAPYEETRKKARQLIEQEQSYFFLVHVNTSLDLCEERDRKGLYAQARQGHIQNFTGISDPYETPCNADLCIDTKDLSPEEGANKIMEKLKKIGLILCE